MITIQDVLMAKGPSVIVASPSNTVCEAAEMMAADNVGSLIIREGDQVVGVFTERDLLRRVVARHHDPKTTILADVMSSPVISCRLEEDIETCARRLRDSHIRHLAVIEDGALVGVVGMRDLVCPPVPACAG